MIKKIAFILICILGGILLFSEQIVAKNIIRRADTLDNIQYYHLKKGYDLYSEVLNDSSLQFTLKKGKFKKIISTELYAPEVNDKYNLHYSNIDFEDYVVLTRSEGNYIRILYLYQKSTGENIFYNKRFLEVSYDVKESVLFYFNDDNNENPSGNLTLLDLKNQTSIEIDVEKFTDGKQMSNYYYVSFNIEKADSSSITITYTDSTSISHTFKRAGK